MNYFAALGCVLSMVAGQLLFKASANAMNQTGTLFSPRGLALMVGALFIYAVSTLAWVWLLRRTELGRIYPIMALAFVFVPIGSHLVFGEAFDSRYFLGIALIVSGILVTALP